jgi:hypothetical protein
VVKIVRTNVLIPLVVILVPLAFVVGCTVSEQGATESSDGEQAASEETTGEPPEERTGNETREQTNAEAREGDAIVVQGDTEVRVGTDGIVVRAGDAETRVGSAGSQGSTSATGSATVSESPTGEATLEIQGNPGTEFSGTCTVGEEVNEIGGQAPERFTYQLDGRRIECEIRQESAGNLGVVFTAGASTSSVQQINSQGGTINLVYENGSLSSFSSSG